MTRLDTISSGQKVEMKVISFLTNRLISCALVHNRPRSVTIRTLRVTVRRAVGGQLATKNAAKDRTLLLFVANWERAGRPMTDGTTGAAPAGDRARVPASGDERLYVCVGT